MRSRAQLLLLFGVTALVVLPFGCTQDNDLFVDPGDNNPCEAGQLVIESFNLADPGQVDILFVVDNSPGTDLVQEALADAMPSFVQALDEIDGLDYHLGIVSTDIVTGSQQGRLQTGLENQTGCPGDRPVFVTRSTPSRGTVAACNAVLGSNGDEFEAGLEAVRYALLGPAAEPGGINEGFLRADAHLVVIVVSNEDDCSDSGNLSRSDPNNCVWDRDDLIPLDPTYIGEQGFFTRIKSRAGQPLDMITLVGPDDGVLFQRPDEPQPVCTANGPAFAGRRYSAVLDSLGDRGGFYSICTRGYAQILVDVVATHIAPRAESVCPFLTLTQEPVSVRRVVGDDVTAVPNGSEGYLYVGQDDVCPRGRLLVSPEPFGGDVDERLEVHYCTEDPVP